MPTMSGRRSLPRSWVNPAHRQNDRTNDRIKDHTKSYYISYCTGVHRGSLFCTRLYVSTVLVESFSNVPVPAFVYLPIFVIRTRINVTCQIDQLHILPIMKFYPRFLSRISIRSMLMGDIDIANLSVCPSVHNVAVSDENGLTYRHSFFTIR